MFGMKSPRSMLHFLHQPSDVRKTILLLHGIFYIYRAVHAYYLDISVLFFRSKKRFFSLIIFLLHDF